jgi:hypothetical protein
LPQEHLPKNWKKGEVRKILLERPQFNIIIKSDAGIGYVAILVLLAILSTMGLTFIYKVGIMSSVTLNRRTSMQAHYLAESAANHALWRLLNDPGFTPESDKYYMHSLGDGRFGFKVRKPTETTFATVATVGAIGDIATQQSYVQYIIPSNVFTVYGNSTSQYARSRRLIGAQWTDPYNIPTGGAPMIHWAELEGCPTRKELVGGVIDSNDDITLIVWDGTAWDNQKIFSSDAGGNYKSFDIAYESQSGDALVVGRYDATTTVRYNVWDGTAWLHATAQPAFDLAGGAARLVVMASCPGNDQILIATVNSLFHLQLFLWNGSVFTDLGVIETSTHADEHGTVQIVYEQQSGDALVIWTIWAATPKFRVWNGATLGPENIVPIFLDNVYFLRAASDPTSDTIVVGGIDKFYDITVGVWDGTAWTDSREVETDNANTQGFDVAWEASGEDALVVWAPWSAGVPLVRSLAWEKGTALADSTVEQGPDVQNQPWLVRLHPISQSEKIILLVEDSSNDLRYSLWNGERLKGDPAVLLEPDVPVQNEVAFDLAEANVPRTGGTGSGSSGNQAPVVDAGPDQTIYLPTNQVNLDGTVTDDGLPNPPAAVTTTWSVVSGPGTVNIDDSSLVDTVARFSEAGDYVLRLTADDSDLTAFDEVTITVIKPCTLLFVVGNPASLTSADTGRKGLFESWGYIVTLIDDGDTQANFDAAIAANDVVYVGPSSSGPSLLDKVTGANTGVVNEINGKLDNFGFSSSTSGTVTAATVSIVDNTHYITSESAIGLISIFNASLAMPVPSGTLAPDLQDLAEAPSSPGQPAIVALESGAQRWDGGTAPERRVYLPYVNADLSDLTADAQIIMKRAIDWAAHKEGGCGGVGSDTDPPTPDPMTWASPPAAVDATSITMTATTAIDPSGVQYYFECTAGGGNDSGWQTSSTYVDSGLSPETQYTYRVKARDKSANYNETGWSTEASATTPSNEIYVYDIAMGFRKQGKNYFGQATVWIKGVDGTNISGAVVSGDWSGAVSGSSMGNTGSDGKVMYESASKKNGGTFTFTVTSVVKTGYTYNPSLNVEDSDTIIAP